MFILLILGWLSLSFALHLLNQLFSHLALLYTLRFTWNPWLDRVTPIALMDIWLKMISTKNMLAIPTRIKCDLIYFWTAVHKCTSVIQLNYLVQKCKVVVHLYSFLQFWFRGFDWLGLFDLRLFLLLFDWMLCDFWFFKWFRYFGRLF